MPTKPATKRRADGDETRRAIVAAALELFADRNFDGATTREIAERAGITQPLLNYHFAGKEDLWRAAVDDVFARLTASMAQRLEGLRGVEDLTVAKLMVRHFVEFSAANPQLHRIIVQESKADGPRLDWLVEQHVRPLYENAATLFERLVERGLIAPISAPHFYYLLTGAGPTVFVLAPECRRLTGIDPFEPEFIAAHADAVERFLFAPATDRA